MHCTYFAYTPLLLVLVPSHEKESIALSPSNPFLTMMHPLKSVPDSAHCIIFSAYDGWKALATSTDALEEVT